MNKNCSTCEFNFGIICAGCGSMPDGKKTYGEKISKLEKIFPNGCSDYGISLKAYIKEECGEDI